MPIIVVSLADFLPPARFDGIAWKSAQIAESALPGGPWTVIDVQALPAPFDPDPTEPALRSFTTSLATLQTGWYQVTFFDGVGGTGGQSEASDPIRNALLSDVLPPTPDQIRNASPLLRKKFPLPSVDPYAPADLRQLVYQAVAEVQALTWRILDPTLGCAAPEGEVCEIVPAALVPIAVQAVSRMAERIKITTDPAFAEQVATGRRLRGFGAGPYNESYFAPGEFARKGASQGRPPMDTDDVLDAALWALATEDARDYFVWRATGMAPPTGFATAFDYRRESIGYAAGGGGYGGGLGRGGPDGY